MNIESQIIQQPEPVKETPVPLPRGWKSIVFSTFEHRPEEDPACRVVLMKAENVQRLETLATFPLDQTEESDAWARDYAANTPGCLFGGPEA